MRLFKVSLCLAIVAFSACGGGGGNSTVPASSGSGQSTNQAPVLAVPNPDQSARVGAAFSYDATQSGTTFTDADGDTLSYSLSYDPAVNGLTDSDGMISGTPSQDGTISVTITASDGNGASASDSFDIVVASASQSKPNILFIISDDQGQDSSAQYNISTDIPDTPHLNGLADDGLVFENLWVNPVCSPTRAALLSGKHALRTNVFEPGDPLPDGEIILHSFFSSDTATQDYASALIGKWHLGGGNTGPNDFGIDHFAGITGGGVNDYFNWSLNVNGSVTTNTNYVTSELTNQAIDWVSGQSGPWFLWLAYNAPHTPFHLPPANLHNRNLSGDAADIDANSRDYYLAAIEAMDTEIGRLLDALPANERDNTLVIFIGDNGTPRGATDPLADIRGSKGSLYEGGVRVPFIASGAGVTRTGEREDAIISHTDMFSSLASFAGANLTTHQDGQNFSNLFSDDNAVHRDHIYSENSDGFIIRNDRYKLVELINGSQSLYDLEADPEEQVDLLTGTSDVSAILSGLEDAAAAIRQ